MSHFMPYSIFLFFLIILNIANTILAQRGEWQILQKSVGISAMHMQLLNNDHVIMFDRANFGPSNITLPRAQCHGDPSTTDCTAHSVGYDVLTNTIHPLNIVTDTWCSSGATLGDGTLLQSGGFGRGDRTVRTIKSCPNCDWIEFPNQLFVPRWYATNHILPNGTTIVIGGRNQTNYEFLPKTNLFNMPFLVETTGNIQFVENNLYPFVFLNVDGNLFIFANNRAILFDYNANKVVRTYPIIPGGEPRNYPSTGSAVLLPLKNLELESKVEAEVLVCGGTPPESYLSGLVNKTFLPALDTCARIKINDPNPTWVIKKMPMARTMGDMVILPNGDVTIINGANYGSAGWELGRNPILNPVIYHPDSPLRFEVMSPNKVPRMYHSTAVLLRDGRVLVGGSNPHEHYNFSCEFFPTELSLEAFSPPYLDSSKSGLRPTIILPSPNIRISYGSNVIVKFTVSGMFNTSLVKITMIRPAFCTHSFSMNQRMLVLTNKMGVIPVGPTRYQVNVLAPGSANIAPPGFYMLFVVHQDIPSEGVWVQML
ncbi:hypothetical protein RND81_13G021400 [Saponaria officinalis]|uniref:Galactose oxidase n=1 Tax=Saponaria officinalis TaxID=3572 RepID=A0AAW1GV83_SAPOF